MGLRNSKYKRTSYDVAPVVSNKNFSYKNHTKPLPKVELPAVIVTSEESPEQTNDQEVSNVSLKAKPITETNDGNEEQDERVPSWVNKENFKNLLMKLHPNLKDIVSFKAYPAMAAGENYATLVLRVKITASFEDGSSKDFSFMLKIPHEAKESKDMMQVLNFFIIENTVYSAVIPELEDMYRQAGVEVLFGPKSHKLDLDDPNIHYVLMDDLGLDGFRNANRLECLDMEHTLCVLRKMAQFHAASACRVAKKGDYGPMFSRDLDNEMARTMLSQMFLAFKKPFLDNLKHFNDAEKYREPMDKFFDNLIELFIRNRKLLPGYFSVLNHGDSWSNNILFKYSADGKLSEAAYVDFQNTNWSSPAMDLYYFIISSAQIDIKLSQFEYFVRYYHEHLTNNLKLLNYPLDIPNLREFHVQILDFGCMATITAFLTLGIVLLDPTENAKFENFLVDNQEGNDFRNAMYTNERYIKHINEILPWLYNRGFMDINLTELDNRIAAADKLKESMTTNSALVELSTEQPSQTYPEWLNEALFIDVVRTDCENYQKILKFIVSPATNAGDNYSSILLKIDIDVGLTDNSTRSLSYMLKIPPNGEKAKALVTLLNAFEKEKFAYYDIIPQFEQIYKEHAGVDIVFAPKSYKLNENIECEPLVLENLKVKGFQNGDRLEGLDMEHTKAVLKKLAEFHAVSAYVFETKGKYSEIYNRSLYSKEFRKTTEKMTEEFLKLFQECIQQYDNAEEYIDKVNKFIRVANDAIASVNVIDWNKFNVLNHGDCWTNNVMFQYDDEGHIKNTYFVDFQLSKYGSPVHDLYYFLLSSPKLDLKLEYFDYFIRYYHENLKSSLELLKYPKEIPSLKELHIELINNGACAFHTVMGVMAAVLMDPSDKANLDNMIGYDDDGLAFKKQMFLNNRYKSHAQKILPWLCSRGLLDLKEIAD